MHGHNKLLIPLNKDIVNIILKYIVPLYTSNDIFNWITTIENELNTLEEEDGTNIIYLISYFIEDTKKLKEYNLAT